MIGFACKRYPAVELFRKMRGLPEFPNEQKGAGDVISHLSEYDGKHHNVVLFYYHYMVSDLSMAVCLAIIQLCLRGDTVCFAIICRQFCSSWFLIFSSSSHQN